MYIFFCNGKTQFVKQYGAKNVFLLSFGQDIHCTIAANSNRTRIVYDIFVSMNVKNCFSDNNEQEASTIFLLLCWNKGRVVFLKTKGGNCSVKTT